MLGTRRKARRPFHLMAKPTGYRCNIACDYCFYLEKEEGTLRSSAPQRHMSDEILAAYVRSYIDATPAREVEFMWQGGEPTIAGIAFFERALALQAKYGKGKVIRNSLQTNGLLIDDAFAMFLSDNGFLVGLSIDGPPELHDRHRKLRNGAGVSDRVVSALDRLKKFGVEYNILAVVNSTTAKHPVEVYRYLTRDLGTTFVQFIPAVERRACGRNSGEIAHPQSEDVTASVTDWSVSGEDYGRFMIGVFDEWVRQDVGRVHVQLFENALAAWLGEKPSLCVMQATCGFGLVIELNGDIYSCDHYVYSANKLGNIRKHSLASLVESRQQRIFGMAKADLPRSCLQCEWRFACHGGCPKHRIQRIEGHWHNHLCRGYKSMFEHMSPYLHSMVQRIRHSERRAAMTAGK